MSSYELSVAMEQVAQAIRQVSDAITVLNLVDECKAAEDLARTLGILGMDLKLLSYRRSEVRIEAKRAGV